MWACYFFVHLVHLLIFTLATSATCVSFADVYAAVACKWRNCRHFFSLRFLYRLNNSGGTPECVLYRESELPDGYTRGRCWLAYYRPRRHQAFGSILTRTRIPFLQKPEWIAPKRWKMTVNMKHQAFFFRKPPIFTRS